MDYKFRFIKGRSNVEIFRVNVKDPINGNSTIDPAILSKIELIIGNVVMSSDTGEITWNGDVIQIQPSLANLELLEARSYSGLVIYQNGTSMALGQGFVFALDYS